jgi:uncharacterized protein (TIGR02284 family)
MDKLIAKLNDLIALDIDAYNAYESAISRMTVPILQSTLRQYQADHERHIQDLTQCVTRFGGEPRKKPDVKGFFIKGFTAVTSMMGDEGALQAMRGNETLTNRTYKSALSENWSEDVRAIIEKNYQDEQRHLAFIVDALRNRLWEQTPSHP